MSNFVEKSADYGTSSNMVKDPVSILSRPIKDKDIRKEETVQYYPNNNYIDKEKELLAQKVASLELKNKVLLEENDLLNNQRREFLNSTAEAVYTEDSENLLRGKVLDYRKKLTSLETALLEAESKRIESLNHYKQMTIREREENQNKINVLLKNLNDKDRENRALLSQTISNLQNTHSKDNEQARTEIQKTVDHFNRLINEYQKDKLQLCKVISDQREEIDLNYTQNSELIKNEILSRNKISYLLEEKKGLEEKIKRLEGMYISEIGEVKSAEAIMKDMKNKDLEMNFLRDEILNLQTEKSDLKIVVDGLKSQMYKVEIQRDNFENMMKREQSEKELVKKQLESIEDLKEEIEEIRHRESLLIIQSKNLTEENQNFQDRLKDMIELNQNLKIEIEEKQSDLERNKKDKQHMEVSGKGITNQIRFDTIIKEEKIGWQHIVDKIYNNIDDSDIRDIVSCDDGDFENMPNRLDRVLLIISLLIDHIKEQEDKLIETQDMALEAKQKKIEAIQKLSEMEDELKRLKAVGVNSNDMYGIGKEGSEYNGKMKQARELSDNKTKEEREEIEALKGKIDLMRRSHAEDTKRLNKDKKSLELDISRLEREVSDKIVKISEIDGRLSQMTRLYNRSTPLSSSLTDGILYNN